jgi:hypothetical protein
MTACQRFLDDCVEIPRHRMLMPHGVANAALANLQRNEPQPLGNGVVFGSARQSVGEWALPAQLGGRGRHVARAALGRGRRHGRQAGRSFSRARRSMPWPNAKAALNEWQPAPQSQMSAHGISGLN